MNENVPNEAHLFQISFILDDHRYQQDVRMDEATATALRSRLSKHEVPLEIQDLQVYRLNEDKARFNSFSALDFLETVTGAVGIDLSSIPSEEEPGLEELRTLADALGVSTESADAGTLKAVQVDFTWDNGGGDDNAFTDGYAIPASLENQNEAFQVAFSDWIESQGHAYDVCYQEISADADAEEMDLLSGLEDLVETLKDNYSDGGLEEKWIKVLEGEIHLLQDDKPAVVANEVVANKVVANKVVANKVVANKVVANKVVADEPPAAKPVSRKPRY